MEYLIGYDITDKSRLLRVHRMMCGYALPLQLSVFLFTGTRERLEACLNQLRRMIDEKSDDVRCYRLIAGAERYEIGRKGFSDGQFVLD